MCFAMHAQINFEQSVIGSVGGHVNNDHLQLSYTVGEPIVHQAENSSILFTQGFHQPLEDILVTTKNASCDYSQDGMATLKLKYTKGHIIKWSNEITSDTNASLLPGKYSVQVELASGRIISKEFTIQSDSLENCYKLIFYSGITPNNDGKNDAWVIDGIQNYPTNQVSIYDRWGILVWQGANYNNTSVVWEGKSQANTLLPIGTYFFVFEADGYTSEKNKGWIQVSR